MEADGGIHADTAEVAGSPGLEVGEVRVGVDNEVRVGMDVHGGVSDEGDGEDTGQHLEMVLGALADSVEGVLRPGSEVDDESGHEAMLSAGGPIC